LIGLEAQSVDGSETMKEQRGHLRASKHAQQDKAKTDRDVEHQDGVENVLEPLERNIPYQAVVEADQGQSTECRA
jgi:hypothetical protein